MNDIAISNSLTSLNRRDFLKLKFLFMFYFYFFNGLNPFINSKKSKKKVDYTLLDKLERLPFSDEVKKEVHFRIYLQRKYRYNARGELHPLDRFVREISDFK